MRYCLCLALVLLVSGCGYWGRARVDQSTRFSRSSPVWIWTASGVEKWHDVFVGYDSVRGIPIDLPVGCGSCLRSIPLTRVDSLKVGYKTGVQKVSEIVGGAALFLAAEVVLCAVLAPHSHDSC